MNKETYTAKEAMEILKKPSGSFYREVREGRIPHKGKRPNMQFPKEAIDAIAELEAKKEDEKLRFVESTIADAWIKQEIVEELFQTGNDPYEESEIVPFKVVLEWRKRNNDIGMHVEEKGKILGWTTFLPLEEKIIKAIINDELSEKDIPPKSVKRWTDKDISVYVPVIQVIPTKDKNKARKVGAFLIRNTIRWAISLTVQHDIKNWYGIATSEKGEELMKDLNFKEIEGHGKYKGYVLDKDSKKAKIIKETLDRIEETERF